MNAQKLETEQPNLTSIAPSIDHREGNSTQSNDSKPMGRAQRHGQPISALIDQAENLDAPYLTLTPRPAVNDLIQRNLRLRLSVQIEKYGDHIPPGGVSLCWVCNTDLRVGSQMCAACHSADLYQLLDRIDVPSTTRRRAR